MTIGRMRMGNCSGCERSVIHNQLAPRISMVTDRTFQNA